MKQKKKLTQSHVKSILKYDTDSGILTWLYPRSKDNEIAGCKDRDGYICISIGNSTYKAHRIAWLYVYGYMPENYIDHIDRDKSNNRINNLREVSMSCNKRNTGNQKNNKSGVKGVHFCKNVNKYIACIMVNGKSKNLGHFKDFDNAVCARLSLEQCFNWEGCDSSSPAYQYVKNNIQQKEQTCYQNT